MGIMESQTRHISRKGQAGLRQQSSGFSFKSWISLSRNENYTHAHAHYAYTKVQRYIERNNTLLNEIHKYYI